MVFTIDDINVGDVVKFKPDLENGWFDIDNARSFADGEFMISAVFEDGTFCIEDDEDEWFWKPEIIAKIVTKADDSDNDSFESIISFISEYDHD